MQSSKLGYRKWAMAIYLMSTGIKGTASMKLHRDIGVTQKTAWHMAHRIRESWSDGKGMFNGPVEVDETYVGGKERNKHTHKKLNAGRGVVGKAAVVGMKDRSTNMVNAEVTGSVNGPALRGFVSRHAGKETVVYTDDALAYRDMPGIRHQAVKHSIGQYVDGKAHTNGIESFWAPLPRPAAGPIPVFPVISVVSSTLGPAPQLHPFPDRSPSRQREKPLVFEEVVEHGRLEGAGISRLFVTGFRSA